jgi:hypothetical protein
MRIFVCTRFTHYDVFLFEHFMKYYLNLGVYKFLLNLNYKMEHDQVNFENFLEYIKNSSYIKHIIYNIGPNVVLNETCNINMLNDLVNKNVNLEEDYIIPADSDEFQEFSDTLENVIKTMTYNNYSYLDGCTKERVSENGEVIMVETDKNIFEQFPKYNHHLFCQPKIGIIKAKYFKYVDIGHHSVSLNRCETEQEKEELSKSKRVTITNHFRWNLQSKVRMENWIKLWSNENYHGWKDITKYKKMLNVFNSNLLEYINN